MFVWRWFTELCRSPTGWSGISGPSWSSGTSCAGSGRTHHCSRTWTAGTYCSANDSFLLRFYCPAEILTCVFSPNVNFWLQGDRGLPGDRGEKVSILNKWINKNVILHYCTFISFIAELFSSQGYCLPYLTGVKGDPGPPGQRVSVGC